MVFAIRNLDWNAECLGLRLCWVRVGLGLGIVGQKGGKVSVRILELSSVN